MVSKKTYIKGSDVSQTAKCAERQKATKEILPWQTADEKGQVNEEDEYAMSMSCLKKLHGQ